MSNRILFDSASKSEGPGVDTPRDSPAGIPESTARIFARFTASGWFPAIFFAARLPQLLATMVQGHPVQVVDFGDKPPGGGPASPLWSVDLAAPDAAAHLTSAAFLHWTHGLVHVQRAQDRPSLSQLRLPTARPCSGSRSARRARSTPLADTTSASTATDHHNKESEELA